MSNNIDLKKRRQDLDLTLEQVAEIVGVGKSTVRKWEKGIIKNMRRDNMQKLAEALQLSPLDLLEFNEDTIPSDELPTTLNKNTYGDHQANLDYFADKPELLDLYKQINASESLQLLFDSAKDLSPEDLESVLIHIQGIRKARGLD